MNLLLLALRNWRLILGIVTIVGLAGIALYLYQKGASDRESKLLSQAALHKIAEKEKLDEIRNAPLSVGDVIERLQSGTF